MNLSELIGFVVSFGLFVFLMVRRALEDRRRRKYPELEEEEGRKEDEAYRQVLRRLDVEEEDEDFPEELRPRTPPPPTPKLAPRQFIRPIQSVPSFKAPEVPYEVHFIEEEGTRLDGLVGDLSSPKQMLVYYEIFGPPKAFRKD